MNYHLCPLCGAHLDPGEKCDCTEQKESYTCADDKTQGSVTERG